MKKTEDRGLRGCARCRILAPFAKERRTCGRIARAAFALLLMLAAALPAAAQGNYSGGDGTKSNPYIISNVGNLQDLAKAVNGGERYTNMYFKLTADLDLANVCGKSVNGQEKSWTPIGDAANNKPFKGTFDGGNHTISSLYINAPESDFQGLFGYIEGATIEKLNLVNSDVKGRNTVGGVCGVTNESSINHCANSGIVSGTGDYVGGVCGGANESSISHCLNSGIVSGTGDYVGGVCGWTNQNSKIEYCANSGNVSGTDNVGGVCGRANESSISHCLNSGSVSGTGYVGGVCGYIYESTITSCYYDKQMCTVNKRIGNEEGSTDAGKLTSDMAGESLKASLGETNWKFNAGMYPVPAGLENNVAAIVAATPIFLANGETAGTVNTNFTVGTGNGVKWTVASGSALSIDGGNVTVEAGKYGACVVTATLNGAAKSVSLIVVNSKETPITIENLQEFQDFRDAINDATKQFKDITLADGGKGLFFKLTDDLDLSSVYGANVGGTETSWTPIGTDYDKEFQGHFNGGNHTITNLYINNKFERFQGLFGYISGAEIKNLSLTGVDVTGQNYVGGVCGYAKDKSTISNCLTSGSVNGAGWVGGVCGYVLNSSTISNCLNTGSVNGSNYVGGVCGYNDNSTFTSCYYDKQMCTVGGINGRDVSKQAEGKPTTEMVGESLKEFIGEGDWFYIEKKYPRLKGSETSDAAIVAATPIFLANGETAGTVKSKFTVGTENNVTWTVASGAALSIVGEKVSVEAGKYGACVLTATLNGATKSVSLIVVNTKETPITIENLQEFRDFRDAINDATKPFKGMTLADGGKGLFFKLTDDLDLKDEYNATKGSWTPIGRASTNKFQGHFNGDGHTISNLYINASESDYQGLFGYISGATIEKLNLVGTDVKRGTYVGGVCGWAKNSSISNCTNSGSISGAYDVGGVCGTADGSEISNCTNSGSICVTGGNYDAGGVCGFAGASSVISYCANSGSVSGSVSVSSNVGGVCGAANSPEIRYCTNTGSVSGIGNVGGVCGRNDGSTINSCYYDKQMCTVANGIGATNNEGTGGNSEGAEGKLTSEMVGESLKELLGDATKWAFSADMYPIPARFKNYDVAIVAATPIFLHGKGDGNYENANTIVTNF